MSFNQLTITKLEAAKSQIETAIELFFEDKDSVSIHTLTCAAYEVLMDIGKTRGIKPVVKDTSFIRPGKEGVYLARINEAENFFKHADRDPDRTLAFRPQATLLLLWDACRMYQALNPSDESYLTKAFGAWFFGQDPEILDALNEGPYKEAVKEMRVLGVLDDKKSFLARCQDAHWQRRLMEWSQMLERAKEAGDPGV